MMRLMPLFYWSYNMIWNFIIQTQIPYCALYERGFTYVGDQSNSIINPFLQGANPHAFLGNDNLGIPFFRILMIFKLPLIKFFINLNILFPH